MTEQKESRSFALKVNGIEMTTSYIGVVAHDILEFAEKNGAIPGKPEGYLLQGDKGQYGWNDWVDLEEDNRFIAISIRSTQVA